MSKNYELNFDEIRPIKDKILQDLKDMKLEESYGYEERCLNARFFWERYFAELKGMSLKNFQRKLALMMNEIIEDEEKKGKDGEIILSIGKGYYIPITRKEFYHGRNCIFNRGMKQIQRAQKLDKMFEAVFN